MWLQFLTTSIKSVFPYTYILVCINVTTNDKCALLQTYNFIHILIREISNKLLLMRPEVVL